MLVNKCGCEFQENLFAKPNQDSTISHTGKNSNFIQITSKYCSFLNNF